MPDPKDDDLVALLIRSEGKTPEQFAAEVEATVFGLDPGPWPPTPTDGEDDTLVDP